MVETEAIDAKGGTLIKSDLKWCLHLSRRLFLYSTQMHKKKNVHSYMGRIPAIKPTAATTSIFRNILKDLIFKYFDMEKTYRHFDDGKMLSG